MPKNFIKTKDFFLDTHECQETQIKNPFDPILSFGLVNDFWKWKNQLLQKEFFTKDFQRTHIYIINKLMVKNMKW